MHFTSQEKLSIHVVYFKFHIFFIKIFGTLLDKKNFNLCTHLTTIKLTPVFWFLTPQEKIPTKVWQIGMLRCEIIDQVFLAFVQSTK